MGLQNYWGAATLALTLLGTAPAWGAARLDLGLALPDLPLVAVSHHTMAAGDTISDIARQAGLQVDTLLSYNQIRSPRMLRPGLVLQIPNRDGIVLNFDQPMSVDKLASQYQIFASLLLKANSLPDDTKELSGRVFVPGAKFDDETRRKTMGVLFAWPVHGGRITSYFGRRNDPFTGKISSHSGVDIANPWGSPVFAAGSGVVIDTSYDPILGNHIRVDQGDGYMVVYGHLSKILTREGDRIRTGQVIGKIGTTGYSTGPHLHFSAYRWNRLLNPMTLFG
jgi:murein DD-endopeptidase MepM/ murein hydrolase activator NlpD